ncbi:DUF1192 domain-containing protein [Novosphingobium mangrovi (ex Huang et al. 2023)]|uniref:DUF1192 domain-containing protein n=1 Tax=Novosphingobium mangrovi (ex Huang et al. 2023) TaxID=2976432 RepID=A0ABT2I922_9SPHN|nr:DUF1192 domain-containing protein [Novosphingobium mangrovi (ex Huang et al. 2023)]MCT2401325.1 DUF1192 domain-containing protein [Novosphingobium mangrovi (ex Huang et al. 2023)]
MDDDDRPRRRSPESDPTRDGLGAASLLASESLERYSLDELDARVALLEDEIVRIKEHRKKSAAHMAAADALFRPRST